ncbi:MAG: flagellar biosynthetic protein FliO [Desulfovibrionaceae bacterium]|nr:flagellar biosynthetic protein FliO [Desulfovibrionaceae bacterium]
MVSPATDSGASGSALQGVAETVPAVPAQIPVREAGEAATQLGHFSWSGYLEAVGILCFLLALLWLLVWVVRRYGRFSFMPRPGALPRGALVMEAQMPLGPRKGLMVVRFLNRRLLLGVTEQQITLLSEEKAQHEPHADFEEIMEGARNGPAGSGPGASGA